MSEIVTNTDVIHAFESASGCVTASNCRKAAEAMVIFYQKNNQTVMESGKGLIMFCDSVDEVCPNQDQLFCQDR